MSEGKAIPLPANGIHLTLYRYRDFGAGKVDRTPVLLLHGASASHLTFMTPDGGLARWLMETGEFDPWMLDWRGSGRVVDDQQNRDTLRAGVAYTFNLAAEYDVPRSEEHTSELQSRVD